MAERKKVLEKLREKKEKLQIANGLKDIDETVQEKLAQEKYLLSKAELQQKIDKNKKR